MSFSNTHRTGLWSLAFGSATFLALLLTAHAYIAYTFAPETSEWGNQLIRTITGWYLWAALFPLILQLAREWRFAPQQILKSVLVHLPAGAILACLHAIVQVLIADWLLHPDRDWSAVEPILTTQIVTGSFWRFFVYLALLSFSIAFDSHQRAKEIELVATQMENRVLQTQLESLKTQLDPDFLFQSLRQLSVLMRRNFDQAESLVARLGAYLRMRLDHSRSSRTNLSEEIEFMRCHIDIENIKRLSDAQIEFDVERKSLECNVPAGILQTWIEDVFPEGVSGATMRFKVIARKTESDLILILQNPAQPGSGLWKLETFVKRLNAAHQAQIELSSSMESDPSISRLSIPIQDSIRWNSSALVPVENSSHPDQIEVDSGILQNPVRKWLIIIAIFTALAIYFTIQRLMIHSSRGTSLDWAKHLLDYSGWYVWALITPFVLKLSAKYPLRAEAGIRCAVIHFMGFVACWLSATFAMEAIKYAANLGDYAFLGMLPVSLARSPVSLDVLCYSTIVAIESALRYRKRFEYGTMRAAKLSSQLTRARLEALKMQLHPHFLFNSLNSLSELMQEDPAAAEKMIRNLEMFLRLTVNQNHLQEIPFEKELEFLQCYLAIENVRYQERLNVTMNIEPQAMPVRVPTLLLQPIVENAIRHGIAPRASPGHIQIHAKRNNGVLALSVRDDGPGIRKIRKTEMRSGVGLTNTRERLKQLYGNRHRFDLINAPEGGLIVNVEIPLENRAGQAN